MARTYAAVMALIGMQVILLRAMKDGAGLEGTIAVALPWMALLGALGMVVGYLAQQTIDESVRIQIEAELVESSAEGEAPEPALTQG